MIDSMIDNSNQNGLGFSTNANYTRRIGRWFVGASFTYAQNVSTAADHLHDFVLQLLGLMCGAAGAAELERLGQLQP